MNKQGGHVKQPGGIIDTTFMRRTLQTNIFGSIELYFMMVIGTKIISPTIVGPKNVRFLELASSRIARLKTENIS